MADAPAAPSGPASGGGSPVNSASGILDNPMMVLILGLFTCGIVPLWWMWVRTKELNEALGRQQVNPLFVFPGCICFPLFWYAAWLFAQGFHELKKKKGGEVKDDTVLHTILFILILPVGQFMIQQQLNEMAGKK
jgi:hypothetical protein